MTTTALITRGTIDIVPAGASGNRKSRLGKFAKWLQDTGRAWHTPDLGAYRDHLLGRMAPRSAIAHLSTIRARYGEIVENNATRDLLYDMAAAGIAEGGTPDTPAERKAYVDEITTRMANGTNPKHSEVKVEKVQDRTEEQVGIRLTKGQADALLAQPGLIPLSKLRDTCILAVFLTTGCREGELCALDVGDLRKKNEEGRLCLWVRLGKGKKTRLIPWGEGQWALRYLDKWLARAGITEGPVFRGFYKGQRVRPATWDDEAKRWVGRLTTRAVQKVIAGTNKDGKRIGGYPVMIDGEAITVHPHDLRRTYARLLYDSGMALVAIQQNLGHADHRTTEHYIGVLDSEQREPPSLYHPPHLGELDKLPGIAAQDALGDQGEP